MMRRVASLGGYTRVYIASLDGYTRVCTPLYHPGYTPPYTTLGTPLLPACLPGTSQRYAETSRAPRDGALGSNRE